MAHRQRFLSFLVSSSHHLRRTHPYVRPFLRSSPQQRFYATTAPQGPSLKEVYPGTPSLTPFSSLQEPRTQITTLDSGLRVASEETYGQTCTVGVLINAGTRNETEENNGTTHLLQRMGFKATPTRSTADIVQELETLGVNAISSSSREAIIYSADIYRGHLPRVMEILGDVVLNPLFKEEDIAEQKVAIQHEMEEMQKDPAVWLIEDVHNVAYGNEGLGMSQIAPPHNLENISRKHLVDFVDTYFVAPQIVVAGAGVDQEQLVDLVKKNFSSVRVSPKGTAHHVPAKYKGGFRWTEMGEDAQTLLRLHMPGGKEPPSHILLGFESVSVHDELLYAVCTLQTLMGGGSSFSAGGPGKGMYSRLFRHVLNSYDWVESASAFNTIYEDSGLFGIYGTAEHNHVFDMIEVMCTELMRVAYEIGEEELVRAKNQLKSSIFTNLESRSILFDDIGRQVLSYGHRKSASEVAAHIDNVTAEDVKRVARQTLVKYPSLVVYSPAKKYSKPKPSIVEEIHEYFKSGLQG